MSKGNPVYQVRLSREQEAAMLGAIVQRNRVTGDTEWTPSDFIRRAIDEKLAHMKRSRRSRKAVKHPQAVELAMQLREFQEQGGILNG